MRECPDFYVRLSVPLHAMRFFNNDVIAAHMMRNGVVLCFESPCGTQELPLLISGHSKEAIYSASLAILEDISHPRVGCVGSLIALIRTLSNILHIACKCRLWYQNPRTSYLPEMVTWQADVTGGGGIMMMINPDRYVSGSHPGGSACDSRARDGSIRMGYGEAMTRTSQTAEWAVGPGRGDAHVRTTYHGRSGSLQNGSTNIGHGYTQTKGHSVESSHFAPASYGLRATTSIEQWSAPLSSSSHRVPTSSEVPAFPTVSSCRTTGTFQVPRGPIHDSAYTGAVEMRAFIAGDRYVGTAHIPTMSEPYMGHVDEMGLSRASDKPLSPLRHDTGPSIRGYRKSQDRLMTGALPTMRPEPVYSSVGNECRYNPASCTSVSYNTSCLGFELPARDGGHNDTVPTCIGDTPVAAPCHSAPARYQYSLDFAPTLCQGAQPEGLHIITGLEQSCELLSLTLPSLTTTFTANEFSASATPIDNTSGTSISILPRLLPAVTAFSCDVAPHLENRAAQESDTYTPLPS